MDVQETILRACSHEGERRSEVKMPGGEIIWVCCDCWNASVYARRAERKAALAALPRCEINGCRRRATGTIGYRGACASVCGRHAKKVERAFDAMGGGTIFGVGFVPSRDWILKAALRV